LLLPVARIEDFQLAAQDRRQPEVTLASFRYQFPAPYDAARAKWLQHGEFPIIEPRGLSKNSPRHSVIVPGCRENFPGGPTS
jgi:hypothetical protein